MIWQPNCLISWCVGRATAIVLQQSQFAFLAGTFHLASCNTLLLTAHAAHATTFNPLIFFGLSLLSIMGAQQNLCAENCVFTVIKPIFLSSLHTSRTPNGSSLHTLLIARSWLLLNWSSRACTGFGIRQLPLMTISQFSLHEQKSTILSVTSQMGRFCCKSRI